MGDADEVKTKLNIVDVISERVTLKKAGRNYKGLCPFHTEKTPSFMVNPDRQTFKCFGCGKGGSVIDFVMEYEHVDFVEALETLASRAGVTLTRKAGGESAESSYKKKLYEINHLASEYFQYILQSHALGEKARLYLKGRGISDKVMKTFRLGYSPSSWDALTKYLLKKGYDQKLITDAGLAVPSARGGYDRFRGRVMFTLSDHRGRVMGFSGRVLDPAVKEAKYINTSETPVYIKGNLLFGLDVTKDAIRKENTAILMEGEFDVISSFQEGIPNAVAIKGSALTEAQVMLIRRFAERLTFALDSDMAGDAAARRGIAIADRAGLDMNIVSMPAGKDPDEAVREDAAAFKNAVKKAKPIFDYFIESALKRHDPATPFGKRKAAEELFPIIGAIENPVVQSHYIKKAARALDTSEESVTEGIRRAVRSLPQREEKKEPSEIDMLTREEKLEQYLLAILLQTKPLEMYEELVSDVSPTDITQLAVRRIIEEMGKAAKSTEPFSITGFADTLPKELEPMYDRVLLWDLEGIADDEERTAKEWMKGLQELRRIILRRKIRAISAALSSDESQKEHDDAQGMRQQLAGLTNDLRALEKSMAV